MFPVTIAFGTLIIGLITVLAINTSRLRATMPRESAPEKKEALRRAMRAHGNNFEHGVPVILLMMFYELSGANLTVLCSIGLVYLVARLLFSYGMITRPVGTPHLIGATATYLVELALIGLVLATLV